MLSDHPSNSRSTPGEGGRPLIAGITSFLSEQDPATLDDIRRALARELDEAGPEAIAGMCEQLAHTGEDWRYYAGHPLAQRIHEILADRVLTHDCTVDGLEHLVAAAQHPLVICANHLSYSDANVLAILLQRAGATDITERLTVIAGPKVFSSLKRRFSSLCFGTIKVPQSNRLSTDEAVMATRDVALAARRSIDSALERLTLGETLLLFGEGTRSRDARMQPMLPGAVRYLAHRGTYVLPVALAGTESLFPVGERAFRSVPIRVHIGRPLPVDEMRAHCAGNRRVMVDCIGLAIADLLPGDYRGAYAAGTPGLDDAARLLAQVRPGRG